MSNYAGKRPRIVNEYEPEDRILRCAIHDGDRLTELAFGAYGHGSNGGLQNIRVIYQPANSEEPLLAAAQDLSRKLARSTYSTAFVRPPGAGASRPRCGASGVRTSGSRRSSGVAGHALTCSSVRVWREARACEPRDPAALPQFLEDRRCGSDAALHSIRNRTALAPIAVPWSAAGGRHGVYERRQGSRMPRVSGRPTSAHDAVTSPCTMIGRQARASWRRCLERGAQAG